ncbi:MAG: MCE family protein [Candidatus Dadabacteria bacterium]|nr:MCE family protein [Candidatus Dadabacteria bacterium]NIS07636.1 MCE family protein [Candidatus Dadabacteria bacterium]NIV42090.1 MCE family protein [Candidatus Dadabacteria bacterium]NIX16495.1 MCE family protein [Candidatus Dadabacteria bacterium]NIY21274.1 MCE family protein [Candidatus Dadabacteria bacterium]
MKRDKSSSIKVGIFVLLSIVAFIIFVFMLGGDSKFFARSYKVQTSFTNVAGLSEGASVRLSGVRIGSVKEIKFPKDIDKNFIVVLMDVKEDGVRRIGLDAIATIKTEGLLGDKYIEIIKGSKESPEEIKDVIKINSFNPADITKLIDQSDELIGNIINISESLDEIVKAFGKEENINNISNTIASFRRTIEAIEKEGGVLNTLIYGKENQIPGDKNTLEKLDETIALLNDLLGEIKSGDGLLTALLFEEDLKIKVDNAITNIEKAAESIGDDEGMASDLRDTVANLKSISEKLDEGEGTIGAMINDPLLYDQLNTVLGEAERSRFVRATIKYLIEQKLKREKEERTETKLYGY